jgi:hypothetical protein
MQVTLTDRQISELALDLAETLAKKLHHLCDGIPDEKLPKTDAEGEQLVADTFLPEIVNSISQLVPFSFTQPEHASEQSQTPSHSA